MNISFDCGTIALTPAPGECVQRLPGVRWDARVGGWRAPALYLRGIRRVARTQGLALSGPLAGPPPRAPGWRRDFELRSYQRAALQAWASHGHAGVVVLPTGAGKTRVACAAIAALELATLVLVPTRVLLHQWVAELGRWYRGAVTWWGDGQQQAGPVTVSTYASMWRHMDRLGDRFGMLVADEAHHFGAPGWQEVLELCTAGVRLGLTATMPEDTASEAAIRARLGPVVYRSSLSALAGSALAPFRRVVVPIQLAPDEARAYARERQIFTLAHRAFRRLDPEGSWADFVRSCRGSAAGRQALEAWRRSQQRLAFPSEKRQVLAELVQRHRADRVLIFASDNATVYAVAREHLVAPITCDIRPAERDAILAAFRRGELRALVSARVLNEGLDVPAADVGIVVGARGGIREHVQRVGRLLRPAPGKVATVYELVVADSQEAWKAVRRGQALVAS